MRHVEDGRAEGRRVGDGGRAVAAAVRVSLCAAGAFELPAALDTQVGAARAASPWQDDPYHSAVSLAALAIPLLVLAVTVRLLAWRAPGGPDRARQTVRAAGAMTALAAVALAFQWAAFLGAEHREAWRVWTWVLVGAMAAGTAPVAVSAVLLARCSTPRRAAGPWRHDWLGDAVAVCGRLPVLRRRVGPGPPRGCGGAR